MRLIIVLLSILCVSQPLQAGDTDTEGLIVGQFEESRFLEFLDRDPTLAESEFLFQRRWSTGWLWWKKTYREVLIRPKNDENRTALKEKYQMWDVGSMAIQVEATRRSDINGWGVRVNGENTLAANFSIPHGALADQSILDEFQFATEQPFVFLTRYLGMVPNANDIAMKRPVRITERGFIVIMKVSLVVEAQYPGAESIELQSFNVGELRAESKYLPTLNAGGNYLPDELTGSCRLNLISASTAQDK